MVGAAVSASATAVAMLFLKTVLGNRYYNSTGSYRWMISAVSLIGLQAGTCVMCSSYLVSAVVIVGSVIVFPFLVGLESFKITVLQTIASVRRSVSR